LSTSYVGKAKIKSGKEPVFVERGEKTDALKKPSGFHEGRKRNWNKGKRKGKTQKE